MTEYRLIDLFAGCGGMTLGFARTSEFEPILAVEFDHDAAETYERNFGPHVARSRDSAIPRAIEDVERFPAAEVVIGGPPCQGFSALNMAGVGLERRGLWREYLRALEEAQPSVFVMENVPQLLRSGEYEAFAGAATRLGYTVEGRVLNAADYGVPQVRKRAIVIGSGIGRIDWPQQTHAHPEKVGLNQNQWTTFAAAVEGLSLEPDKVNWHRSRNPRPQSLERYKTIPAEGEGRFELARRRPDITPACWLRKKAGSTDVFGRLWWDRPAYTIRTEFYKPEKGRYLHPSEHRPLTVREAARCMTFPDEFEFPERQSMTSVAKQIGNAVPPVLAQRLAECLAASLAAAEDTSGKLTAVAA